MTTLLKNAILLQNGRPEAVDVLIEDEYVRCILPPMSSSLPGGEQPDNTIDLEGRYLSHGFIDIHVHGGGGHDFMDNTTEAYRGALELHLSHGTTGLMPTTVASSPEQLEKAVAAYDAAAEDLAWAARAGKPGPNRPTARMLGMHIEGPYLSLGQAGAQDPKFLRDPDAKEYRDIIERHPGVRRWTVAPELPGSLEMGDYLVQHGALPSAGHSDATYAEMQEALSHGYTHLTHLYSAMSTITRKQGYRSAGLVESAYLMSGLTVEIIADGCHLPASLLQMVYRFIGPKRTALVTDAMRGAGVPEGPSVLGAKDGGLPVILEDGVAKLPNRSAFAGSTCTADRLVETMVRLGGAPLPDAIRMMTQTPAAILGLSAQTGSVLPGRLADLNIFTMEKGALRIERVFVGGRQLWGPMPGEA